MTTPRKTGMGVACTVTAAAKCQAGHRSSPAWRGPCRFSSPPASGPATSRRRQTTTASSPRCEIEQVPQVAVNSTSRLHRGAADAAGAGTAPRPSSPTAPPAGDAADPRRRSWIDAREPKRPPNTHSGRRRFARSTPCCRSPHAAGVGVLPEGQPHRLTMRLMRGSAIWCRSIPVGEVRKQAIVDDAPKNSQPEYRSRALGWQCPAPTRAVRRAARPCRAQPHDPAFIPPLSQAVSNSARPCSMPARSRRPGHGRAHAPGEFRPDQPSVSLGINFSSLPYGGVVPSLPYNAGQQKLREYVGRFGISFTPSRR